MNVSPVSTRYLCGSAVITEIPSWGSPARIYSRGISLATFIRVYKDTYKIIA